MLNSVMFTAPRVAARSAFSPRSIMGTSNVSKQLLRSRFQVPKPMSSSTATTTTTSAGPAISGVKSFLSRYSKKELATGGLVAALAAQSFFGSSTDYYDYRFVVRKDIDPDDLASFYGSDNFMELFVIFPIFQEILMRGGYFDDDGVVHTYGIPFGELLVSMAFTDETDEETGRVEWFNKRERFKNLFMGYKVWDTVSNFGFHTLDDGRLEVYHHGEYFLGKFPLVSLAVKIAFLIQHRWVAWATEHHLNHRAFTSETDEEEEIEALSRSNHMLYMIKYHFWGDFKAMLGITSHKEGEDHTVSFLSLDKDDDEEEVKKEIPIKRKSSMRKVEDSLAMDKAMDLNESGLLDSIPKDIDAFKMAHKIAIQRHESLRVVKRRTTKAAA